MPTVAHANGEAGCAATATLGLGILGDSTEGVLKALAHLAAAKERERRSVQTGNGIVALE